MKTRRLFPVLRTLAGICVLAVLPACSLLHRHRAAEATAPAKTTHRANAHGLELEVKVSPDPLKLGEVRELSVAITLRNVSKLPSTLKFPTTQILEIALRDVSTGAVVSKWSTDREFTNDGRIVLVNRDEHLEYTETITTRELKPGKPYNVEVSFIGYENELSAKKVLIPLP